MRIYLDVNVVDHADNTVPGHRPGTLRKTRGLFSFESHWVQWRDKNLDSLVCISSIISIKFLKIFRAISASAVDAGRYGEEWINSMPFKFMKFSKSSPVKEHSSSLTTKLMVIHV